MMQFELEQIKASRLINSLMVNETEGSLMALEDLFDRTLGETELKKKYRSYISQQPKVRQRDIAHDLAVSEAALVDEQLGVESIRLRSEFGGMIERFPELGYIMTLMRNDFAVHERKGIYQNIRMNNVMGLVISDDRKIDLRLFMSKWKYGYAVREYTALGWRYSLQFFNECGVAIQKIFMQPESNMACYEWLVKHYKQDDQVGQVRFFNNRSKSEFVNDDHVDRQKLTKNWQEMTDVHQFVGILRQHNVDRQQAFRLVGKQYAEEFSVKQLELVLEQVAERKIPIMCFVGNQGAIQIHSGEIERVKAMGPWLNILDPEFKLHLLETGITHAWLVRKPTVDGIITSLELYDAEGNQVVQFFGKREEGHTENLQWKRLAESVLQTCESGNHHTSFVA